jgi:hypothetical protein
MNMYINCCTMQVMPFDNTHSLTTILRLLDRLTNRVYPGGRSLGSEASLKPAGEDVALISRLHSIMKPCQSFSIWGTVTEEELFLKETGQIGLFVKLFIDGMNGLHNICEYFISILTDDGASRRRRSFNIENIDRTFGVLRHYAGDAIKTTKGTTTRDRVTVEFCNILLDCVPISIFSEEIEKPSFNVSHFISKFLSSFGDKLSVFHGSLSGNQSFTGRKGTLFLGELKIVVRNLIQSNDDLLSASDTDAKDQVELQKLREPPVAMFPASGEAQDWDPDDRFFWTPGHPP